MPTNQEQKFLRELIQRVLDEAPFSMRQIAEEAGISYDAIRSWATERRTARRENVAQLASALEHRSERLRLLAAELRENSRAEK